MDLVISVSIAVNCVQFQNTLKSMRGLEPRSSEVF